MSAKDDMATDAELDAFLQGQDELAALLKTLPQPAPPAELDAAILAAAELAMARGTLSPMTAANDPAMPQSAHRPRPAFFSRWKLPLGLAASLLLPLAMWQWHAPSLPEAPVLMAAAPAMPEPAPAAMPQTAQDTRAAEAAEHAGRSKAAPQARNAAARLPAPAAAPVAIHDAAEASVIAETIEAKPAAAALLKAAPEKAKTWLTQIETLIKTGKQKEALDEWSKFGRTYPDYPVPKQLLGQIEALKK